MSIRAIALLSAMLASTACTGREGVEPTQRPATPAATPPVSVPSVVVGPPTPAGPPMGTVSFGWPTLTVNNADRTGSSGSLVYRFDISRADDFQSVEISDLVPETPDRTSYTPSSSQAPAEGTLYWRVVAIDQPAAVQSEPSEARHFTYLAPTEQNRIAAELGVALWPGPRPAGRHGRARLGPGWQVRTITSFNGVTFLSPPVEAVRLVDLLDRGYAADQAIGWMRDNGYPSVAAWYPGQLAIGLPFQYMALVQGRWELVVRVGG
jgi:hypothetical protein